MSFRSLTCVLVVAIAGVLGLDAPAQTTTPPAGRKQSPNSRKVQRSPTIFENREIRIAIPKSWHIVPDAAIKGSEGPAMSLGNSISQGQGKLILEKNGYTLGIAYNTSHASGVEGGRFIEAFNIPWPGIDDVWDCSMYLRGYSQPASRTLIFNNFIIDSGDPQVQEHCGIPKDLGALDEENVFQGERRWFGGDFTTADGALFFESKGAGCGLKAYTLTYQAKTPDLLPVERDPKLKKMIQEAIDLVNDIHYKRCAPLP